MKSPFVDLLLLRLLLVLRLRTSVLFLLLFLLLFLVLLQRRLLPPCLCNRPHHSCVLSVCLAGPVMVPTVESGVSAPAVARGVTQAASFDALEHRSDALAAADAHRL
jgi:hypothetical protein